MGVLFTPDTILTDGMVTRPGAPYESDGRYQEKQPLHDVS